MTDKKPASTALTLRAGGEVKAIIPQTFGEIAILANAIFQSNMKPSKLSEMDLTIAIMWGMELGLTPMAASQEIAVINGKPAVYGNTAMAIVRASGFVEYIKETQGQDDDGKLWAKCEARRKGEDIDHVRTFTQDDAAKAGLWSKSGVWANYPKRMLQHRARGQILNDVFPDCLKGLATYEEVQDYPSTNDSLSTRDDFSPEKGQGKNAGYSGEPDSVEDLFDEDKVVDADFEEVPETESEPENGTAVTEPQPEYFFAIQEFGSEGEGIAFYLEHGFLETEANILFEYNNELLICDDIKKIGFVKDRINKDRAGFSKMLIKAVRDMFSDCEENLPKPELDKKTDLAFDKVIGKEVGDLKKELEF